jgi:hypothetical protein
MLTNHLKHNPPPSYHNAIATAATNPTITPESDNISIFALPTFPVGDALTGFVVVVECSAAPVDPALNFEVSVGSSDEDPVADGEAKVAVASAESQP